ncbi:MAG: single-stranded-DNA-specific exonuclease RecJ [Candidatus Portnoybacteria bacterium RIFCSPLOWO2_12_FULL_39_9]|uniref:Single-stranded-DNA-specific exonuclease RecJ n=1 Tax=Candidatus Portnoybacteria bacterium RIFCSPHIGHO2_12_FULL_38_9 TaxID=1801997 RepID=A0A1G2FFA8_9BACT|nr:MAG: single-stranded-DNA-specific exonuclease RecJ [Candidatus Portnoybacteria bacterium RBG_13_40_8]OGZ36068.1 MAG: single-stranded-DNA-specific exonuclease RecJ [Candidatus Portnoybacteria bacterium RIFCSPHIGHO2_02_FULL_39_12]OGZ36755.1 MAG: single-stranded-DNA-specific exonuclease RecJ [Candidatus Portnoybacteria bacterium RIFCSPHIGHO2_12_FULL_38_9]OGZ38741.1 MAG: single-stranded-DNA-specific exonuclease RecJ [Candidatus Portnoybacteria bacterium RIFCSPLOWO2_01_FULL_38_39]OGZ40609.1 MAG: 
MIWRLHPPKFSERKFWRLKPKAPEDFIKQFPEYSPLVLQLLYNRGLKTQPQIDEFFNSDYEQDLHDPFLFKGMKKAVSRILKAVKKQEKIIVYGDYDADGVCSSAILMDALQKIGAQNLAIYIPDRNKEGHGLHLKAVKNLAKQGGQLIITLDCGITGFEAAESANSSGIDVIIADHHRPLEKLPKAKAVIDPHQPADKYPFKELAGAGVAFKLAQALLSRGAGVPEGIEKWFLDLVALATIADVMPLIGENRTLVKYGLGVLAQTKRIGLQELMKAVRLNPLVSQPSFNGEPPLTNLDSYTLAYILAPRINVASRLDHANTAYQLLMTQSKKEAEEIARQLDILNRQRQEITDKIVKEIEKRLDGKDKIDKIIFEGDAHWPLGMVGLAASKITEKYHRPSFIFNLAKEKAHGSWRSIPDFNIMAAISKTADLMEGFGGHPGAAGCVILEKNLELFKKKILTIADKQLKEEDLKPILEIDTRLFPEEISFKNYDQIQSFAPFGQNNQEPKFLIQSLEIRDLRVVGNNGKHLKLEFLIPEQEGKLLRRLKAIGFGLGEKGEKLKVGDKIDLVFKFIIDEWNGTRDLQMKVVDLRMSS